MPYRPDTTANDLDDSPVLKQDEFEREKISAHTGDASCLQGATTTQSTVDTSNPDSARNVKILLVEDSLIIQKATTRLLRNNGHSIDIANNGVECLQRIGEKQYDLILMDINMPVMDGLLTIQCIREDEILVSMMFLSIGNL